MCLIRGRHVQGTFEVKVIQCVLILIVKAYNTYPKCETLLHVTTLCLLFSILIRLD